MVNSQTNAHLAQHLGKSYFFNETGRVWSRQGYAGIAYSDGDFAEKRLLEIVSNSQDIGTLSTELRQHCSDWVSLYHLSPVRANILRPFKAQLKGDILEIGAGCGAITRFLGESGANILALEGSINRAQIARARTRDLTNVTVLAERFSDFNLDLKFDVITLIGVLEYANLFTEGSDPYLAMLRNVRRLLKPDGRLIIAIENQLGLKYFAGAHEDHVGKPMFGIENRYTTNTAKTFGRIELTGLLEKSGFPVVDFLACFPDYKTPSTIITNSGMQTPKFDAATLAGQSFSKDHLKPEYFCFSPELVWPSVIQNGLGIEMANSFLISAGISDQDKIPKDILAYHYSAERRPEFTKAATFKTDRSGNISVNYESLTKIATQLSAGIELDNAKLTFEVPSTTTYSHGRTLAHQFITVVTKPGWKHEDLRSYLRGYVNHLEKIAGLQNKASLQDRFDGRFIDCIPGNIIIRDDGSAEFIDTEWALSVGISVSRVVFRGLLSLLAGPSNVPPDEKGLNYSFQDFITLCFRLLGFEMGESSFLNSLEEELRLQSAVAGVVIGHEVTQNILRSSLVQRTYYDLTPAYKNESQRLAVELHAVNSELSAIKSSRKWRIAVKISNLTPTIIKLAFRKLLPVASGSASKKLPLGAIDSP
jgi:2-polyprenyl-3-methyl-5-hydroxy-6-metoxy-1,4-benzoquinol methylase